MMTLALCGVRVSVAAVRVPVWVRLPGFHLHSLRWCGMARRFVDHIALEV